MTREELTRLVESQAIVRVYDGAATPQQIASGDAQPVAEGEVIAVILAPTLVIVDKDGNRSYHSSELPVTIQEWRRL